MTPTTPEAHFALIVRELMHHPNVTPPEEGQAANRFGSSALKIKNKIFAMLVRGNLVVKLPKARVKTLIANGKGMHFEPRRDGRGMKEWIVLDPSMTDEWLSLSREALAFVESTA